MVNKNEILVLAVLEKRKGRDRQFKILSLNELEASKKEGWAIYFGPACLIPIETVQEITKKEKEIGHAISRPNAFGENQVRVGWNT